MNKKALIVLAVILVAVIMYLSMNGSEYNQILKEYMTIFNNTVVLIDSEAIYDSIYNNNLTKNMEQLNELLNNLEERVPNNKVSDFIILRTEHEILKEVIYEGLKWDLLNNIEKLSIRQSIEMLKSNQK